MSEDPEILRTPSGRELTDADIEALADEAEKGYDVEDLKRVMTPKQDALFQEINNSWPIDTYEVADDGEVSFVCEDGSTGTISANGGEWGWDG